WLFYLKKIRAQPAGIGDAFSGFGPRFWQYFLVYLIPALIVFAFVFVLMLMLGVSVGGLAMLTHARRPPAVSAPLALGLAGVGIVGGAVIAYLQTCWYFAIPLAA